VGPPAGRAGGSRPSRLPSDGRPLLERLADLFRLGWLSLSNLTNEDLRVLGYLALALLIAVGSQIDFNSPPSVSPPDQLPAASAAAADTATAPGAPAVGRASPAPSGGGKVDDPTSKGQITAVTAHGLAELKRQFGPVLRGEACWDPHLWNPKSDHPLGKACDVYTSPAGQFASGEGLANGNRVVAWLRQNAGELQISYVIWQGRIWSPQKGDRPYNGGGVYNAKSATGGHFDHLHVSFRE
jgi:hypothetical protein